MSSLLDMVILRHPIKMSSRQLDLKVQNLEERAELDTSFCQLTSWLLLNALVWLRSLLNTVWNLKKKSA